MAARISDGQSIGQIAERFKTSNGTVQNILERYRDSGSVAPKPQNAGRKPAFYPEALRRLERDVLLHPDATLAELRERSGLDLDEAGHGICGLFADGRCWFGIPPV